MAKQTAAEWRAETQQDIRFVDTLWVCRATSTEQHALWWRYAEHYRVPWSSENLGAIRTIGTFGSMPVNVQVFWTIIGRGRVAFIESPSMVTHYDWLEEWSSEVFPHARSSSNADNFINILLDIEDHLGEKLYDRRRVEQVENLFEIDINDMTTMGPLLGDLHAGFTYAERKMQHWAEVAERYRQEMNRTALGGGG